MGVPAFLLGLTIPLIGGIALALLMFNISQQNQQISLEYRRDYNIIDQRNRTRKNKKIVSDQCTVCLEEMTSENAQTIQCGHMFHSKCLVELNVQGINKCPNCRATIIE